MIFAPNPNLSTNKTDSCPSAGETRRALVLAFLLGLGGRSIKLASDMGMTERDIARQDRDEQQYPMAFGFLNSYFIFGSNYDKYDKGAAWKKWVTNVEEK